MVSKEEFLNGNWWLVIAKYPVACDASINEVIESEKDPTLEDSYANELIDECINSFSYLDEFTYDWKKMKKTNLKIGMSSKEKVLSLKL